QPQRETIEDGARLCRIHAELISTAQSSASTAKYELSGFFSAQADFDAAEGSSQQSAHSARELATRANTDSSRAAAEIHSIGGGGGAGYPRPGQWRRRALR